MLNSTNGVVGEEGWTGQAEGKSIVLSVFQDPMVGDYLQSYPRIAFECSMSGIISCGLCRSQKRVALS